MYAHRSYNIAGEAIFYDPIIATFYDHTSLKRTSYEYCTYVVVPSTSLYVRRNLFFWSVFFDWYRIPKWSEEDRDTLKSPVGIHKTGMASTSVHVSNVHGYPHHNKRFVPLSP